MRYLSTNEAGTSFFMRKFGADVGPTKQFRELTINSFEAHEAQMLAHPGERYTPVVEVFVDPYYLKTQGVRKLAHADNAIGMSAEQLESHFAQLFVSGKVQATDKNFGIGSRVATARFNPRGVEVRSWHNGRGNMIRFELDSARDMYGLVDWDLGGFITNVCPLDETTFAEEELALLKPRFIDGHGTVVVLLGVADDSDTTIKPTESDLTHKDYWYAHVVNRHLFSVPSGIKFTARIEADHAGRVIHGYKWVLDKYSLEHGSVDLSDTFVHWWLLDPAKGEERKLQRVTYHVFTGSKRHGHVAALWKNELFDFADGYDGIQMLNRFGIVAGHDNVAIYVEPKLAMGVEANLNRTSLVVPGGLKLPWRRWGEEFASKMPPQLVDYVTKHLGHSDLDDELDKMIRQYGDDFRVPEYVPAKRASEETLPRETGPTSRAGGGHGGGGTSVQKQQERIAPIRVPKAGGEEAKLRWLNRPRPKVFIRPDPNTGEDYDFRDRAADYLDDRNILFVNGEFNVLQGLIEETARRVDPESSSETVRSICKEHVEAIYSMQLLYTVMTARATFRLRDSWDPQSYAQLVSPESLTACVLPRIAMRAEIKRRVNADPRLAAFRSRGEAATAV